MARLEVKGVSKLFGGKSQDALSLLSSGATRDEIFSKTGSLTAVRDISFSVDPGELFAIVGLSGSGKSTLVRCINRLVEPTTGSILLDGVDILKSSSVQLRGIRQKRISMVFQHFALLPHQTVRQNVEFGLRVAGVDPRTRKEKSIELIELVGLGQWVNAYPSALSGGMRQRVGIARALTADPDVLLMDEPFGALDPLIRWDMQRELRLLQDRLHKSIIFITHDLHEAMELGDRVAVMRDGQFVQVGQPEEILSTPADSYVANFIREVDRTKFVSVKQICRPASSVTEAQLAEGTMPATISDYIYVVDEKGIPSGVFSANDVQAGKRPVDIVRRDIGVIAREKTIASTYELVDRYGPVAAIDEDGKLVGYFSGSDVTRYLATNTIRSKHTGA